MELRQLRYFVAVAEELHFGRAAQRVHISGPALSQQIIALERELGTDLFVRDRRSVRLSEAGRSLLADARKILSLADDAKHRTLEARKDNRGDRVYLDVMRNAYAQTAVAPYSVRARAGAPVATPLRWDELDIRGLRADRFTIRDIAKRLAAQGDPWADMSRHSRTLTGPAQRLAKLRA